MNWKYLAIFCLIWTLLLQESFAQTSIGLRGGYSSSSLTYRADPGRPIVRVGGIRNPTYAFIIEQFLAKNAGIQVEFQYIKLGYTQEDTLGRINQSTLDYVKIPLLSNFYFGNSGRFHIKMGPHFGFLLNATDTKREYEGPGLLPTYGRDADIPKKILYGLTFGTGISKLFGKSTLAADLRFSYEFGRPETQERIFDMNSTNLELTLSYLFQVLKHVRPN